ncbi:MULTISPECIES: hypothetical protein [Pyrobaculum]|uniref:Uncharacterized protein n=2 Tax=Pyrobaculum arsenaticum TaxID=121277 RepID=A4WJB0_PYRAR|nr:hypothetical protein [Pyrobaculum arsenaticum]ABP50477.1 conserved hypothetical protein [Pyrobaculum arsenaticum DSM 13514]MCY0890470.1 hypothetical protein [Pyrobaculum arsenaticum]NYR14582.1 hypothetical protein [Pyrobaculum arsenaticum]
MKFLDRLRDVVEGLTVHGQATTIMKIKAQIDNLFMLITLGDMLGIPILPPYYSLRLMPYVFPNIQNWKRFMLRERDVTDLVS